MNNEDFLKAIKNYPDFPKKGILFKDISPIYEDTNLFKKLIHQMSSAESIKKAECIIAIDARGFILGSAISLISSKPFVLARKPGKLPGKLLTKKYSLEYGSNELSIQEEVLLNYQKFAIVDDLLATGGTAKCVGDILISKEKIITGLSVVVELKILNGKSTLSFPTESIIKI